MCSTGERKRHSSVYRLSWSCTLHVPFVLHKVDEFVPRNQQINLRIASGLLGGMRRPPGDLFCAKREQLKRLQGLLPESQGQNLALTVLYVPSSLHNGLPVYDADADERASGVDSQTFVRQNQGSVCTRAAPNSQDLAPLEYLKATLITSVHAIYEDLGPRPSRARPDTVPTTKLTGIRRRD